MTPSAADDVDSSRDRLRILVDRIGNTLYRDWASQPKEEQALALRKAAETAVQLAQEAARLAGHAHYAAATLGVVRERGLVEELEAWRQERAQRDGVAPFVVLRDRALRELVRHRPATLAQLASLPDVGEAKAHVYADDLLAILERHRALTTSTPIWFVKLRLPQFGRSFVWVPLGELSLDTGCHVEAACFGHGRGHLKDPEGQYDYAFADVEGVEPQPESQCSLVEAT